VDRALHDLDPEFVEDRSPRAAGLEQAPAFEDRPDGRKLAPVGMVVRADVQDRQPGAANQRDSKRMRERALAGSREIRGMDDRLDERRNRVVARRPEPVDYTA
jgi:hypothetical protein